MIEAHDRFSVGAAIEIGNWLEEFDITWFETPVLSNDVDALIEVAKRVPVRVIAGERMHELHDFARFLNADVTDIINPEPLGVGGVWRTLQIAGMARAHHAQLAPHNAESPLKTMIALHIDAVTPNIYIQECFDDFLEPWVSDVLHGFERVQDGKLHIPDTPGFGVELDETEAAKHPTANPTSSECSNPDGNAATSPTTRPRSWDPCRTSDGSRKTNHRPNCPNAIGI